MALFGALGLLGAVGYGYSTLIKGPARGVTEITSRTASETDIFQAANILVAASRENQSPNDCDGDSYIEPFPWRAAGGSPAPAGGGLVPTGTPAKTTDSWGTAFGYCAWDHGAVTVSNNNAGCGGSAALRRNGGDVKTEYVLAVISAGPDRQFQSTCADYVNSTTPMVNRAAGSDDIYVAFTYAEAFDATGMSGGGLGDIPDEDCTPENIGLMRYEQEVVQVCLDDGAGGAEWKELGAETNGSGFNPTSGVERGSTNTSNAISFTGFFGTRLVTVDNGGTLVVNGDPIASSSAQISPTDTVAIQGTAASVFSTPKTYNLRIGVLTRSWVLTTRAATPPVFSISPAPRNNMNVTGTAGTAYGSSVQFTVTNTGESTSGAISAMTLSNLTNFQFTGTNTCTGATLAGGSTCTFYVIPKASAPTASYNATLTVGAAGTASGTALLSGAATGWGCTQLSWAGTIANPGGSVTAYQYSSAATCNGACPSQVRACSGSASLSGSYTYQSCNPLAACTYSWQVGGWGGCSASCGGGSQTRSVWCLRSDGTTVANAYCGGGQPAGSQSCNTHSCVLGPYYDTNYRWVYGPNDTSNPYESTWSFYIYWGGAIVHSQSGSAYSGFSGISSVGCYSRNTQQSPSKWGEGAWSVQKNC